MNENLGKAIVKRLEELRAKRQPHENTWRECYDYTFPIRGDGLLGTAIDAETGKEKRARLLDSTGADSATILASAMMSGLTPANARWFQLDVGDDTEEEKRWLDEAADRLWEYIHASNFDAAGFESMLDMVCVGWFGLFIGEDKAGFQFEQWPISQLYCAASKSGGAVDIVYRTYKLTAQQAANEYGENGVSKEVRDLAEKKPDEFVEFIHAIEPRKGSNGVLARNMPIASIKVEAKTKHVVSESGFQEMPVIVPRWVLIPGSVYAVGKVYDCLPDLKELNDLEFLNKSAIEMAIAPPLVAEDDGVLNPRSIKIGPRKIIVANNVDGIKPLYDGANIQAGWASKESLQNSIRKQMLADQLTPRDGPALTATEVHANMMLLRQIMGPTFGRMQPEYLQKMIERCFGIAYRAGALGVAPDSLAGRDFNVKYISPLARAQKLEDVTAMDRLETTLLTEAQANSDVLDLYDWDEAVRHRAEMLGVPLSLVRGQDMVDEIRAGRKQEQAQQQQATMLQDMAVRAAPQLARPQ